MTHLQPSGKDRILLAARNLFAARGFDGVTIRDIGEAAGLTNPALYRHFRDKEALGVELYRRSYGEMLRAIDAATADHSHPLDKLAAYARAMVELYETQPDLVLYVDEHQVRFWPRIRGEFEGRTLSQQVSGWIIAARRAGVLPAKPKTSLQVALIMGGLAHWFAMRSASLVETAPANQIADFFRSSLVGDAQ